MKRVCNSTPFPVPSRWHGRRWRHSGAGEFPCGGRRRTGRAGGGPERGGINWGHWELEIGYANSHVLYFDGEIALTDKAFKRWESRNPWPDEPDYSSHNERIADFSRLKSAQSAHCERYQNALRQCGRGVLKKERNEAFAKYAAVCQRIAELHICTLSDFKAKSRVARFEYAGGPIKQALLKDLQSI